MKKHRSIKSKLKITNAFSIVLFIIISFISAGSTQAGSCIGGAGIYTCSGPATPADSNQVITPFTPISMTILAGFGHDTTPHGLSAFFGDGITLGSGDGLSYTDNNQSSISTGRSGLSMFNMFSGSLTVINSGSINAGFTAIVLTNQGDNVSVNNQGNIIGNFRGLDVNNSNGTGPISIVSTAKITGTTNDGIRARGNGNGKVTINTTADILGGRNGILSKSNGLAALDITLANSVSGGTDFGIKTSTAALGLTSITLNSGASVSSTSGLAISNDIGDSTTLVNTGASITGQIQLNDGSDLLTFAGGDFSGVSLFDGGDDVNIADTYIDSLVFKGSSGVLTGANVRNWENVEINTGSTITFSDNSLTAGKLTITNNGILDAKTAFTLTADLETSFGGVFDGTGGGAGLFSIIGNITNNGLINMQDGHVGDVINIGGNYTGTGLLQLDVDFSTDKSDTLVVGGDVTGGTTSVVINNTSSGPATGNKVLVIDVNGTSNAGNFVLAAPAVSGAFQYDFGQIGADWYLHSPSFLAQTSTYESYPHTLIVLNELPTLQKRITNRYWSASDSTNIQTSNADNNTLEARNSTYGEGTIWGRVEGGAAHINPEKSTTNSSSDIQHWKIQLGVDKLLNQSDKGQWIVGLTGHYGQANTDVASSYGNGSIDTQGGGIGLTNTWFGNNGFYIDGQGHKSWYSSDLKSSKRGTLITDNRGSGYALSLETGKKITLNTNLSITPQTQLVYSSVGFSDFTGPDKEKVSLDDANSLNGRFGLALDHDRRWVKDGTKYRSHLYGIANLQYEFLKGSQIDISNTKFINKQDKWLGEVGVGASYTAGQTLSLYGEVSVASSLKNFGDSYQYKGTIGLKIAF
jgi:outer membrane autotransporter protein